MGKGTTWAPIDWVKEQFGKLTGDMTTRRIAYNKFGSLIEYVNYLPGHTETFFNTWNPKTDFPIQTSGYWNCKIYKPSDDISYAKIELSVLIKGVGNFRWLGSVQSDSTIVWGEIPANNELGGIKLLYQEVMMPSVLNTETVVKLPLSTSNVCIPIGFAHTNKNNGALYSVLGGVDGVNILVNGINLRVSVSTQDALNTLGGTTCKFLFAYK